MLRFVRALLCSVLAASIVAACQRDTTIDPSVADNMSCHLTVAGDLPVREIDRHLYVDARIDEKPVVLIFDTGADTTVLTPAAVARLDLDREDKDAGAFEGIGGTRPAQRYQASDFNFGNLNGSQWRFLVADLVAGMSPAPDGLVGGDFLKRYDIDLDLPGGRIVIYYPEHDCSHPSTFMHGNLYEAGLLRYPDFPGDISAPGYARAAPLRRAAPTIEIEVMIDDKVLTAGLDTGSPDNILFLSGAVKLGLTAA